MDRKGTENAGFEVNSNSNLARTFMFEMKQMSHYLGFPEVKDSLMDRRKCHVHPSMKKFRAVPSSEAAQEPSVKLKVRNDDGYFNLLCHIGLYIEIYAPLLLVEFLRIPECES